MKVYLKTKDYFNTQENFELLHDPKLDMLVTYPKPKDLDKYYDSDSYISHTDKKKTIIDKSYQIVKNYNLYRKYKLLDSFQTKNKSLLDIGAGTGSFLEKGIQNNWKVTGVEPNDNARKIAMTKGIQLEKNLKNIPSQKFDVITMWHVLEHLPNLDKQIKEILSKLKKEGYLVIAVPNYKSYDAKKYKKYWAAYDTPRHLWHFSRNSISKLFEMFNVKLVRTKPLYFDSLYVSLLSEKYKTGKLNYITALTTGILSNIKAIRTKEYSSLIYILKKQD